MWGIRSKRKKGMNENKVENSVEMVSNINLKIVNEKASDLQNYAIFMETVDNTTWKNIRYNQCSPSILLHNGNMVLNQQLNI